MKLKLNIPAGLFAGVDFGITHVKWGLISVKPDQDGVDVTSVFDGPKKEPSTLTAGPDATIKLLADIREKARMATGADIAAMGVAIAGPTHEGNIAIIPGSGNPAWHGYNINTAVKAALGLPTYGINDGKSMGFSAAHRMFPNGIKEPIYVFAPASGIACCQVLPGGALYTGAHGFAGEGGHASWCVPQFVPAAPRIPCGCGGVNHWDHSVLTIAGIERRLRELCGNPKHAHHPLALEQRSWRDRAVDVLKWAIAGDPLCTKIMTESAYAAGLFAANKQFDMDVGAFIILGGVAESPEEFRKYYEGFMVSAYRAQFPTKGDPRHDVPFIWDAFGDPGWHGAALFAGSQAGAKTA